MSSQAATSPAGKKDSSAPPQRLLVRGVNWLGDAIMTTPALQRLREALPKTHITLLTHRKLADLWQNHPSLDAVLTFSENESARSVARQLRAGNFDTALLLPNSPRTGIEAWLARIPRRIGYARPWRNLFLTQVVPPRVGHQRMRKRSKGEIRRLISKPPNSSSTGALAEVTGKGDSKVHQTHEYLGLAAALGASAEPLPPKVVVSPAELEAAAAALEPELRKYSKSAAFNPPLLLGLNPGAEYGPAKRWPAENFATVARQICQQHGNCVWLCFGGPTDAQIGREIANLAGDRIIELAGKTSLRELMARLKLCRLVLTNDTGPMHLAAALDVPVVVPFGSTSPEMTGPGLPGDPRHHLLRSNAPCSPCFLSVCPIDFRCMTGIAVDRVVAAVLQAIG
jgi:heptosyltransferase-2